MEDPGKIPRWELKEETVTFTSRVWELRTRRYTHPHKNITEDFYYINSPDWVVVLGRTVEGKILMVRQFRWGIDDFSWELPGGIVDPGEDPLEAGLREFKEETGYEAPSGTIIGVCHPNPAMLNNRCHFVFADNVVPSESGTQWDAHEEMEISSLSTGALKDWIDHSKVGHSLALVGLFYYQLKVAAL